MDLSVRAGATARLECAAMGHPSPQIAWQKDGGTDFPAARERRMHVMPEDDVFFIVDVKTDDIGIYSCTAQNIAGAISANATLTVLGKTGTSREDSYTRITLMCPHSRMSVASSLSQRRPPSCAPWWIAL